MIMSVAVEAFVWGPCNMNEDATISVVVDTEEEFDWSRPLSRESTAVRNVTYQDRAHQVFRRFGVVPTYVVDYPVAHNADAVAALSRLADNGEAEIGAHLHPWVNPPHDEPVSPFNSYAGNLPPLLERAKLEALTDRIKSAFGVRPLVYRAGRYGLGPQTYTHLHELGYDLDTSVVPYTSFAADGGPDYSRVGGSVHWCGPDAAVLEVPVTTGFCGVMRQAGPAIYPRLTGQAAMRLRAPGLAARLGLLERIRLTPEGPRSNDMGRLVRTLFAAGHRHFVLSYHSPSLVPGNTPYVRNADDLASFLANIEAFLAYFVHDLGGVPATLSQVYARAAAEYGRKG